jgi:KTSC domain
MNVATVESTTLATVAYDELQQLLQLEFCNRAIYLYWGVPAIVHQSLLSARSKGRYFQQAIRGRFPYQRVDHGGAVRPNAAMPVGHSR